MHDVAHACAPLKPDDQPPHAALPLAGTTTDGAAFDLAKLRGKAVLVAFEAPWARVSEQDDATLPALAKAMGNELVIVRVASADSEADAKQRVPPGAYANIADKPTAGCNIGPRTHSWGVDLVPESFLVDKQGNVRLHFVNWRDWGSNDALACVRAVAADPMAALPSREVVAAPQACASPKGEGGAIRGTIRLGAGGKGKPKTAIFVMARRASGGPPVAVTKVLYTGGDVPFVLDDKDVMIAGTSMAGELVVTARYDQDGDALTKQPGDYIGKVTVTSPASNVVIVLDPVK